MILSPNSTHGWLLQRLTAVFIAICLPVFFIYFLFYSPNSYDDWYATMTSVHVIILTVVFFTALSLHAWIGLRDVVIDYIHHLGYRIAILSIVVILIFGQLLWLAIVLLRPINE